MKLLLMQRRNIPIILLTIIGSGIIVITGLLTSSIIQQLIDRNISGFLFYSVINILLWVTNVGIEVLTAYLRTLVIQDFVYELRQRETNHFTQQLEMGETIDQAYYLNMCLYDTDTISKDITQLYELMRNFIMVIISGVVLVTIHVSLLLFTVVLVAVMSVVPKLFEKRIKKATGNLSQTMELFKKKLDNLVGGYVTLFNFTALNKLFLAVKQQSQLVKQATVRYKMSTVSLQGIIIILNIISQLGIIILSGYLMFSNIIPLALIFSIGNVSGELFGNLTLAIKGIPIYYSIKSLLEKFTLDAPNYDEQKGALPIPLEEALAVEQVSITFEDTTIQYPDLVFKQGKKYILTGQSGCGKSTLLKLLNGDIQHYSGTLYWDNMPYTQISIPTLKRSIVTMSQHTDLFNTTIKENIILNQPYDAEWLQEVIKKSRLEEVINQLNEGVETVVDVDRMKLSGGQIQRLALARCLYHRPKILLIDEGTANIDVQTAKDIEKIILQELDATVIMVSHHISEDIAQLADEIVTL